MESYRVLYRRIVNGKESPGTFTQNVTAKSAGEAKSKIKTQQGGPSKIKFESVTKN